MAPWAMKCLTQPSQCTLQCQYMAQYQCNTSQEYTAIWHRTEQNSTVQLSTQQHSTIQYDTDNRCTVGIWRSAVYHSSITMVPYETVKNNTEQCDTTFSIVQHNVQCSSAAQCIVQQYSISVYGTAIVEYTATQHNTIQHSSCYHSRAQYSTVCHCIPQHDCDTTEYNTTPLST